MILEEGKNLNSVGDCFFVLFKTQLEFNENVSSPFEGKIVSINDSQKKKDRATLFNQTRTVLYIEINSNTNSTFISPFNTFSLAANIVVYTTS